MSFNHSSHICDGQTKNLRIVCCCSAPVGTVGLLIIVSATAIAVFQVKRNSKNGWHHGRYVIRPFPLPNKEKYGLYVKSYT